MKEKMVEGLESIAFSNLPRAEEVFTELSMNGIPRHDKLVVEYCLGYVQEKQNPSRDHSMKEFDDRFRQLSERLFDYRGGHLEKRDFHAFGRLMAHLDRPSIQQATRNNAFAVMLSEVKKLTEHYKKHMHRKCAEYYCF